MERVLGNKVMFSNLVIYSLSILTSCQFTNEPNREISRGVFQNHGVCGQAFPLLPFPSPFHFFFGSRSKFRVITRLEMLATQARWPLIPSVGLIKKVDFWPLFPFPSYTPFMTKKVPLSYMLPLLPLSFLIHIPTKKNCNISSNYSKRPHLFNMNKIAKTGGCYGIFTATGE